MTKIYIQLTADELNKWIGEDSDAAIALKSSMVAQFVKRHLKVFADQEMEKLRREYESVAVAAASKILNEFQPIQAPVRDYIHTALSNRAKDILFEQMSVLMEELVGPLLEKNKSAIEERIYPLLVRYAYRSGIEKLKQMEGSLVVEDLGVTEADTSCSETLIEDLRAQIHFLQEKLTKVEEKNTKLVHELNSYTVR